MGFFDVAHLPRAMSGFDKEAERERLREKYEQDQENRAATQRMSELLLKGATMTNSHCDACGDPIFRHDGQEFCPTCQAEGDAADATEADAAGGATPADAGTDAASEDTPAPSAPPRTADESAPDPDASARRAPSSVEQSPTPAAAVAGGPDRSTDADHVETARASLSRTLARHAQAAEDADDPRRATEHLSAAREAAETLAALGPVR